MTQNFNKALANIARGYASTTTRLAKELAPNNHLRQSIQSSVEQSGEGTFIIRVRARGPDARAREYGSGIWARRGPRGKILIRPRNKRALAFYWEKANPNIPTLPDGRVLLGSVEHPGVDAANDGQGYLHPAIRETNKLIRDRIRREAGLAITLDIRASILRGEK